MFVGAEKLKAEPAVVVVVPNPPNPPAGAAVAVEVPEVPEGAPKLNNPADIPSSGRCFETSASVQDDVLSPAAPATRPPSN